jgi:putative intracellular protease/amidase
LGFVTAELHSGRFFKKGAERIPLKTVSNSREPITTMGGMRVMPDCAIDDIALGDSSVLLLPGADTWGDAKHGAIIEKARDLLASGGTVCAICGATIALANAGILDARAHTSNGPGFLELFAPGYKGQSFYVDEPAVADGNLITAGSTGALPWAKRIIERSGTFEPDTLESWYAYFSTGKPEHFFALSQTVSR